ncbi:MAG: putative metal-binding motif-containing protein, partial [Chitinophagales bacterium]
ITGGSGTANGDVTENKGIYDYWIIAITESGEIIWEKSIGGSGSEQSFAITSTLDNHLIVTGYSGSSDYDVTSVYGTFNFWVVKLGICDRPFYANTDGDGYGDILNDTLACVLPIGYVTDSTDCNDADNLVFPFATDICNDIDDNCNGLIDEGAVFTTYYANADGDGFGNQEITALLCKATEGYVTDSTDCNDTNENVYPGAPERFNGLDDNCDGVIDECVHIQTLDANTVLLYPNPAKTSIIIEHNLQILTIITRNTIGEEIPVQFINDAADISAIPPDMYYSEIIAREGRVIIGWLKGN